MARKCQLPYDQNLICIVYHDQTLSVHHQDQLQIRLGEIFHCSNTFTDFIEFSQHLCPMVQTCKMDSKNVFLYELQFGQDRLLSNLPNGQRFQNIDQLFQKIIDDLEGSMENQQDNNRETSQNNELNRQQPTLNFGIYNRFQQQKPFYSLSRESRRFILFQSFIDILLKIEKNENDLKEMWATCCREAHTENNDNYIQQIQNFRTYYSANNAIRYYSKNSCLFRSINAALRCECIEKIFTFHPFIAHLHQQLVALGNQQRSISHCSEYTLYRGVKLPKRIIHQLSDNTNNLISMNGFLST
ncbi:unnamed protein product, partial [Rotaria sordida]